MPVTSPRPLEVIQAEVDAQDLSHVSPHISDEMIKAGQAYLVKCMYNLRGVTGCARCGQAHKQLTWRALTRPTSFDTWLIIGFVNCPTVWEPIFMAIHDDKHPCEADDEAIVKAEEIPDGNPADARD